MKEMRWAKIHQEKPKIKKNSTEWHLDYRPWDRGASHRALELRKGDPGDTLRPLGPLPRAGRALRARSVPEAAKQQPTESRRPGRWRNGTGLPGTAVGGLEIQRQSGPHTRGGTRTIRALGNDSKAEEKLTEATTQRAGAGGPQERGHTLGMGGKNQQLVSHVRTMTTTPRCPQPLRSATSTGVRQLREEHVREIKQHSKRMCAAASSTKLGAGEAP